MQEISNHSGAASDEVLSYEVWVLLTDGERKQFLNVGRAIGNRWGELTKQDATLIEAKIEQFLRITDVPVEHERVDRMYSSGNQGGGGDAGGGGG